MLLALLVTTALLGQTVYEWTDAQGESHFTDDLSSIPKGVKVRTTEGEEISVVGRPTPKAAPAKGARDAGVAPKETLPVAVPVPPPAATPGRDRCAPAKEKLAAAEAKLAAAKTEHELRVARAAGDCQAILRTHGQAEYAKCTRRRKYPESVPEPNFGALEQQVEDAKDALRRVQVGGCEQ